MGTEKVGAGGGAGIQSLTVRVRQRNSPETSQGATGMWGLWFGENFFFRGRGGGRRVVGRRWRPKRGYVESGGGKGDKYVTVVSGTERGSEFLLSQVFPFVLSGGQHPCPTLSQVGAAWRVCAYTRVEPHSGRGDPVGALSRRVRHEGQSGPLELRESLNFLQVISVFSFTFPFCPL